MTEPPALGGRREGITTVVIAAGCTVLALASLFHIEVRAPDYDPQYARDIAERTIRFGGSYYVNGIHNKGPLEPAVYHVTRLLTSFDGFWFGIAVLVMAASTVAGFAARRVVQLLGGPAWLGWAALATTYIHLALSGADYAGVLYSRNMTVTLLCVSFLLMTAPGRLAQPGRPRLVRIVISGACLGLAVQSLQTAALSTSVIALFSLLLIPTDRSLRRGPIDRWWYVGAMALTFVSAPVYHAVFGPWRDFWDGWWVYGRYMSEATDRSLFGQLGLGWHEFYSYSQDHAPSVIAVVLFVGFGAARWSQLSPLVRRLQVLLPCWWVAAWFEIILTQRYSSHYFIVTTIPLALMTAGVGAHLVDMIVRSGGRIAAPSVIGAAIVVGSLLWSGTTPLIVGMQRASTFTGVGDLADERAASRDGTSRSVQAVLNLVSQPDDPMLAWTNYPWPYLDFRRVSATRFIWKSFLTGEIYLGRTSTEFVLPGSWDRWRADVAATRPVVFLPDAVFPVPSDTPAGEVLAADFRPALTTPSLSVSLRNDTLDSLLDRSADTRWSPAAAATGWTSSAAGLEFDAAGGDPDALRLPLGDARCRRWDATLVSGSGASFHFDDPTGRSESVEMYIDGDQAVSRSPNVEFLRTTIDRTGEPHLTLIVGTSSAVLIVDDVVVAALNRLPTTEITLSSVGPQVEFRDVGAGTAPSLGECAA